MKIAASKGIASLIDEKDLTPGYIIVSPFNDKVVPTVAKAVRMRPQQKAWSVSKIGLQNQAKY
jgi:malic enzyme